MTQGVRKTDKKTGRGYAINSIIYKNLTFDWTCPKCNVRNMGHKWLGRRFYNCESCGKQSDIKGQTIGSNRTIMEIEVI